MDPVEFGKYLLIEQVGVGRMAQLWRARAVGVKGLEKFIAVKRLLPHLSTEKAITNLFLEEAKKIIQLKHPNIVRSYDFGSVEGTPYLAAEFIEGKDLRRVMDTVKSKGQALSLEDSLYVISEVCKALQYAHSVNETEDSDKKIVHAGIRPQNVLITYDGVIKISDFCISRAFYDGIEHRENALEQTAPYVSPELVQGKPLGPRSDIFCLGVLLYELLTGSPWFDGNGAKIIALLKDDSFEPSENVPEDLPPALQGILKRCLGRERELRYPSVGQMLSEIEKVREEMNVHSDTASFGQYMNSLFAEEMAADKASFERMDWADATVKFVSEQVEEGTDKAQEQAKTGTIWKYKKAIIAGVGLVLLILAALLIFLPGEKKEPEEKTTPEPTVAKTEEGIPEEPREQRDIKQVPESAQAEVSSTQKEIPPETETEKPSEEISNQRPEEIEPSQEPGIDEATQNMINKGLQALSDGKYGDAITIFEALLKQDQTLREKISLPYAEALEGRGLELEEKNPKIAEKLFLKALELNPDSVEANYHLGLLYVDRKKYDKAIEHYKNVTRVDPQYADAYFNMGYIYAVTKQYRKAEEVYKQVVTLAPPYLDEALFNLAMVQKRMGKRDSCIENLKRAIIVNPENKLAKKYLKKLTGKSGAGQ